MWLRRVLAHTDTHLFIVKVIPKTNSLINPISRYRLSSICFNCRQLSSTHHLFNKPKYVYDPDTDSFLQKSQISKTKGNQYNHNFDNEQRKSKYPTFKMFLKQFSRNLFFLTGALFWVGVAFVNFFVDFQDSSEFNLQLKDAEEEVRLFAFYDIVQNQTDLANLITKNKEHDSDEMDGTHIKEASLHQALDQIKKQKAIVEKLGKPVQLLGYRAARKLDLMVKHFQNLTQFGIEKVNSDNVGQDIWTAECLLEGPEGVISLFLEFEKSSVKQEWILSKVVAHSLENSGANLLELSSSTPDGVKFDN